MYFLCKAHDRSPRVFRKKCRLLLRVRMFSQKNGTSCRESACFRGKMQTSDLSPRVFQKKSRLVPQVAIFCSAKSFAARRPKKIKRRFRVDERVEFRSCYEAGREGFWLHQALEQRGSTTWSWMLRRLNTRQR